MNNLADNCHERFRILAHAFRRFATRYNFLLEVGAGRMFAPHMFDPLGQIFTVESVKKTCVHIAHPDGRIIPFDTFNLFYRDSKEKRLTQLRALTHVHSLPILQPT